MTVALLLHRADGAPLSTPFRKAAFCAAEESSERVAKFYVVQNVQP